MIDLDELKDFAEYVEVGSRFRKTGSDHNVSFGNVSSWHNKALQLEPQGGEKTASPKASEADAPNMENARHLQMYLLRRDLLWDDEQLLDEGPCNHSVSEYGRISKTGEVYCSVETRRTGFEEEVMGVVIGFGGRLGKAFSTIQAALHVFATPVRLLRKMRKGLLCEHGKRRPLNLELRI